MVAMKRIRGFQLFQKFAIPQVEILIHYITPTLVG